MIFHEEKDLALCGLGCVLCSEENCPGCKQRGCKEADSCSVYRCAAVKGLDGCYECSEFPCGEKMLQGMRNRAFNQYARQFGKQALLERLRANFDNGIVYHRPGSLKGDYDAPETEDEIMQLIRFGRNNPYDTCPVAETEHFLLRLVSREDACDLLACYSDTAAQRFLNADRCTSDFHYQSIQEMLSCIDFWLAEYERRVYIRYSIIDKQSGRAVGTIEVFDQQPGVLRIDIASAYEKSDLLGELLSAGGTIFFDVFHSKAIITKAIPPAVERIAALQRIGYRRADLEGREHYFMLTRGE